MSTKFYIKDENGIYLSVDGKTRYSMLEGDELYLFLMSEEGKKRSFHVDTDENGDKIGIEGEPDKVRELDRIKRRERYLNTVKLECNVTFVSGNTPVEDTDYAELFDTIEDESQDLDKMLTAQEELRILRSALKLLKPAEFDLIYHLFLIDEPMTERQYAAKIKKAPMTVHNRKVAILRKLKNFFN